MIINWIPPSIIFILSPFISRGVSTDNANLLTDISASMLIWLFVTLFNISLSISHFGISTFILFFTISTFLPPLKSIYLAFIFDPSHTPFVIVPNVFNDDSIIFAPKNVFPRTISLLILKYEGLFASSF